MSRDPARISRHEIPAVSVPLPVVLPPLAVSPAGWRLHAPRSMRCRSALDPGRGWCGCGHCGELLELAQLFDGTQNDLPVSLHEATRRSYTWLTRTSSASAVIGGTRVIRPCRRCRGGGQGLIPNRQRFRGDLRDSGCTARLVGTQHRVGLIRD